MSDDPGFDEDMDIDEPGTTASEPALEQQLLHAADPEFLQNLVMYSDHLNLRCNCCQLGHSKCRDGS